MNRLASVQLFGTAPEVCGLCGMDTHESNGCCRDEVKLVKLEQDQNKIPVTIFELPAIEPLSIVSSAFLVSSYYYIDEDRHFHNHSPPLLSAQDIYLQNGVFRI
jgi:hypothetical protein